MVSSEGISKHCVQLQLSLEKTVLSSMKVLAKNLALMKPICSSRRDKIILRGDPDPIGLGLYWGQAKNYLQRKKYWQRKLKRMQRKILLINPQFCTYFEEKLSIS